MGKRNKWKSLIELDVQEISMERNYFSSVDLEWTPVGDDATQVMDLCVAIPLERLPQFIKGEGLLDDTETTFICKLHRESESTNPSKNTTKLYLRFVCINNIIISMSTSYFSFIIPFNIYI